MRYAIITIALLLLAGTAYGAAYGLNTRAVDFENANSEALFITDADQTGLDITGNMTIAFWFKPESTINVGQFVSKRDVTGNNRSWMLYQETTGPRVRLDTSSDGSDSTALSCYVDTTFTAGEWQHYVGIYTTAPRFTLYRNGEKEGSCTNLASSLYNGNAVFYVGWESDNNAGITIDGVMDEVMIFDRALSANEVKALYTRTSQHPPKWDNNLQGYWRTNEASGSREDLSGNENDLTTQNNPGVDTAVPWTGVIPTGL